MKNAVWLQNWKPSDARSLESKISKHSNLSVLLCTYSKSYWCVLVNTRLYRLRCKTQIQTISHRFLVIVATPCHWRKSETNNLAAWSSSWMTRSLCLFAGVLWDHLSTISIPSWHGCLQCSSEWCNGAQPGHPWVQLPPGSIETRTYMHEYYTCCFVAY